MTWCFVLMMRAWCSCRAHFHHSSHSMQQFVLPPRGIGYHRDYPRCRFFMCFFFCSWGEKVETLEKPSSNAQAFARNWWWVWKALQASILGQVLWAVLLGAQQRWVPGCRWAPISSTAAPSSRLLCSGCQNTSVCIAECCNLHPILVEIFSSFSTWGSVGGGEISFFFSL